MKVTDKVHDVIGSDWAYRKNSKLRAVFDFLKDEKPHPLYCIARKWYPDPLSPVNLAGLDLRRTASAIRTIRNDPNGYKVFYCHHAKTYRMVKFC